MTPSIFHIDDDIQTLDVFCETFKNSHIVHQNTQIHSFSNRHELDAVLRNRPHVDAFIIDLYLDGGSDTGLSIVQQCRQLYPTALILVSSATKNPELVYNSIKTGADDFISKDIDAKTIQKIIEDKIFVRNVTKKTNPVNQLFCGNIMSQINQRSQDIIKSAVNCVHVFGATGTGKEVVADIFESNLPRGTPFIRVNCGALTPSLILSELFGHVRGSFTGAISDKNGLIQAANNGWIFLDEIATLPNEAQIALLRVIECQKVRSIGSNRDTAVNVRVISATNEKISDLVLQGIFRNDLWQRIRETEILIPTLKERKNEIPDLVQYFCKTMRGGPYKLAPGVLEILTAFDWKDGNARELRNCLRSMTEKSSNKILTPNCLPPHIWKAYLEPASNVNIQNIKNEADHKAHVYVAWTDEERPKFQKLCAMLLLELIKSDFRNKGRVSLRALAQSCGIPKSTLPSKIGQIINFGLTTKSEIEQMLCYDRAHQTSRGSVVS